MRDKTKKFLYRIFFPKWYVIVLLVLSGTISSIVLFSNEDFNSFFSYFVYLLSSYTFIVFVLSLPKIYRILKRVLMNIPLIKLFFNVNKETKARISFFFSILINVGFIVFKFIASVLYKDVWFLTVAFYYVALFLIRIYLFQSDRKRLPDRSKYLRFTLVGMMLLLLNLFVTGIIIQIIRNGKGSHYSNYVIGIVVFYAVYSLVSSTINIFRYRETDPILSATKNVRFCQALMSVLNMRTAVIFLFNTGNTIKSAMLISTGAFVEGGTFAIALYMIIKGLYNLRNKEFKK